MTTNDETPFESELVVGRVTPLKDEILYKHNAFNPIAGNQLEFHDGKINHPPHYTQSPSGVECIQIVEHMNFNRGNAVKYIWRAGDKGDAIEDLKKAKWYIEREIQRIEKEKGGENG